MAENKETPVQSIQANAPIQSIQTVDTTVREGYQPIERKGYQPTEAPASSSPPQSISGIIPLASTPLSSSNVANPDVSIQPKVTLRQLRLFLNKVRTEDNKYSR
jgi:hypothetical protein